LQDAFYKLDDHVDKLENLVKNIKLHDEKAKYFSFNSLPGKSLQYIDTEKDLHNAIEILKIQKIVGIDIEFSEGSYNPNSSSIGNFTAEKDKSVENEKKSNTIACSVQISTLDDNYFIDCLAVHNIFRKYFKNFLEDIKIIKV